MDDRLGPVGDVLDAVGEVDSSGTGDEAPSHSHGL